MKKSIGRILIAAAVLSSAVLCSCTVNTAENPRNSETVPQTADDTETTEPTLSQAAADTGTTPPTYTETSEEYDIPVNELPPEIPQIKQFLTEFKEFSYSYIRCCKAYWDADILDVHDIKEIDGETFYRVIGGDYTTYSALMAAIDRYCSEEVISECGLKNPQYFYEGENDALYVWKDADSSGSVMGSDTAYIESAATLEDSSIKLYMTAWGDKDEWGYEDGDSIIHFEITVKSENGLWKLTQCGLMELDYITWLFNAEHEL